MLGRQIEEAAHIDPRQRDAAAAVVEPAVLIAAGKGGDAAGGQHLRAEVHAVAAHVVIGLVSIAALGAVCQHIVQRRGAVIVVIPCDGGCPRCAGIRPPRLDARQQQRQVAVGIGIGVIVGIIVGIVIGVVGHDAPAVAADAPELKIVLHVPLLGGQPAQSGKVDHAALQYRHLRRVAVLCQLRAAQGVTIGIGVEVDRRHPPDGRQRAPDRPVVGGLGVTGKQGGGVDDLQIAHGLVVAIHEVQQQKLLPGGHAVGGCAGNALKGGADRLRLTAPDGLVLPGPDLRLRHSIDHIHRLGRFLRRRVVPHGGQAAGQRQGRRQQQGQQDQAFHQSGTSLFSQLKGIITK